jgi:cyclopropane-fatty-acyl-phospholipid synthase
MDASEVSRRVLDLLAKLAGHPTPRVQLWDGQEWGPSDAAATIVLNHPGGLRSMLLPPNDLSAGEAYVFDDVDFRGDVFALLDFGARLGDGKRSALTRGRLLWLLHQLPDEKRRDEANRPEIEGQLHSHKRDRVAVTHHYDTGNEFFAQFLDPAMVYSCAHFLSPTESLEQAQRRKLDLVCRKLRLVPEMRLLDVGCGWGALVIHAAQEYGVRATGITLSQQQAAEARRRAEAAGVTGRVEILERDYREVSGEFDAIASVGMVEHVGRKELVKYFEGLRKVLSPGGQILNHGIVTRDRNIRRVTPTFVNTYVFPDGELVPVDTVAGAAEDAGLEVRDAESLRASYALTLRHWVADLERNRDAAVAAAGETVYRIWRLYMAGSAVAFERAAISIYQLLLSDPARPWTYGRKELLAGDDR